MFEEATWTLGQKRRASPDRHDGLHYLCCEIMPELSAA